MKSVCLPLPLKLKACYYILLCFFFAACEENGLRDYVNDHVVAAKLSNVEGADTAGWSLMQVSIDKSTLNSLFQRGSSGLLVIRQAEERRSLGLPEKTVLKVVLDNSRKTLYTVTCSGNHAAYVESAVQDPADPDSVYVVLKGDLPVGNLDIRLHLKPPPAKAPPDAIVLPIVCDRFGDLDTKDDGVFVIDLSSWTIIGRTSSSVAILKTGDTAGTAYGTLPDAINAATGGTEDTPETIILLADIEIEPVAVALKHIHLIALPGETKVIRWKPSRGVNMFTVEVGASITLCGNGSGEIVLDGRGATGRRGVLINGGKFTMNGGKITNHKTSTTDRGGGVLVNSGKFKMTGGTITANYAQKGSGVAIAGSGEVLITGGTISQNGTSGSNTGEYGGGVFVANDGMLTMTDGTISGNVVTVNGGGVYVEGSGGSFTMSGGTIRENTAEYGGGITIAASVTAGAATISGGTISGNTAKSHGGGINVNGMFMMDGGTITGNSVEGLTNNWGGGVAVRAFADDAVFDMRGGIITKNGKAALTKGGGVAVIAADAYSATFKFSGGTIEDDNEGELGVTSLYLHSGSSDNGTVSAYYHDGSAVITSGYGTDDLLTGQ